MYPSRRDPEAASEISTIDAGGGGGEVGDRPPYRYKSISMIILKTMVRGSKQGTSHPAFRQLGRGVGV